MKKIGPKAQENFKENKWDLVPSASERSKMEAYSRNNIDGKYIFEHGCDLLEYSIVVKPYIYKKFNIKHSIELDILLYLYPKQYFTRSDFNLLPAVMYNYTFKYLIELGHFEKCVDNRVQTKIVWRLSENAMKIVREYYLYLSGERVISPSKELNPFKDKDAAKVDEMRERLMLKLRAQSERNPERFRKYYGLGS